MSVNVSPLQVSHPGFVDTVLSALRTHDLAPERLAIVSLARSLDVEVVAEGVETDTQRDALLALGCHSGQGYRFSRPMRAQDVPAFLAARTEALVGAGPRAAAARLLS